MPLRFHDLILFPKDIYDLDNFSLENTNVNEEPSYEGKNNSTVISLPGETIKDDTNKIYNFGDVNNLSFGITDNAVEEKEDEELITGQKVDKDGKKSLLAQFKHNDIPSRKTNDGDTSLDNKFLETDCDIVTTNCDIINKTNIISSTDLDINDTLQDSRVDNIEKNENVKINILTNIQSTPSSNKNCDYVEDIWKKHLHWPKIEEKKRNTKVKDKMPFALVSKEWKNYYQQKESKKIQQMLLKERRKESRKRKAEEKNKARIAVATKKQKKGNFLKKISNTSMPIRKNSESDSENIE
ncbi:hypothetical protein ABEB36_014417 [Hypothenemus hampei]|uniref:Uncharacterized protein n=1 Tax=Hypothenemus hampei TaxID=57062 RepID=A0ABD1E4H3_HYPHA